MKKVVGTILTLLVGVTLLSGCLPEIRHIAPKDDLEELKLDGVDDKKDILGEDGTYLGDSTITLENIT